MDNSVWDWTLVDFRNQTASSAPTPGGGAVAAVSGSLGLALIVMALEISARKKGTEKNTQDISNLIISARERLEELSKYADEDILAFQSYMEALALPKETDEQKTTRKRALAEAILKATQVPLSAAKTILDAIDLAERASVVCHIQIVSDIGAGTSILQGAITAVLLNIDINLPGIADKTLAASFAKDRARMASAAKNKAKRILEKVSAILAEGH